MYQHNLYYKWKIPYMSKTCQTMYEPVRLHAQLLLVLFLFKSIIVYWKSFESSSFCERFPPTCYCAACPCSTHSIHAGPSLRGRLNAFSWGRSLSTVLFGGVVGGLSFVPILSSPCTWQPIWGPEGRFLDAALTDLPVLGRGDDEKTPKKWGGGGEERARVVKVKNGGQENTEERLFRSSGGRAPHKVEPLLHPAGLCPPSRPLLCHSGLDYFILIRLIPPKGKLLITSSPSLPPRLSARGQDEGRPCLIGQKNVKGETEKRPWKQPFPDPEGLINVQVARLLL